MRLQCILRIARFHTRQHAKEQRVRHEKHNTRHVQHFRFVGRVPRIRLNQKNNQNRILYCIRTIRLLERSPSPQTELDDTHKTEKTALTICYYLYVVRRNFEKYEALSHGPAPRTSNASPNALYISWLIDYKYQMYSQNATIADFVRRNIVFPTVGLFQLKQFHKNELITKWFMKCV